MFEQIFTERISIWSINIWKNYSIFLVMWEIKLKSQWFTSMYLGFVSPENSKYSWSGTTRPTIHFGGRINCFKPWNVESYILKLNICLVLEPKGFKKQHILEKCHSISKVTPGKKCSQYSFIVAPNWNQLSVY